MAYQALYRKYRPTTFSEVVGQEHITETLKAELANGKVFHAYLFTGTRGTGKTSCAKILAKAVNCLSPVSGDPCGHCAACEAIANGQNTDVVEIDAASNNGVDDIRTLREQINFIPADSKYRVYIIDEVHMLTESAFNALLKTLEEPPAHIVFVLATTEVHKLPATILSRCQRFDFHRIDSESICRRIGYIAEKENLTVTDEAAQLIAAAADGGMRDALSLLDLCVSAGTVIDEKTVISACGMAGKEYLFSLADAVKQCDTEKALLLLDELYASSVDMLRLLYDVITHYRNLMIIKTVKSEKRPIVCSAAHLSALEKQAKDCTLPEIMRVLSVLNSALPQMQSGDRRLQAEMTFIRLCTPSAGEDYVSLVKRIEALERGVPAAVFNAVAPTIPEKMQKPMAAKPQEPENVPLSDASLKAPDEPIADGQLSVWDEIVRLLAVNCPPSIGILSNSRAFIKGDYLLIDSPNPLFGEMMNKSVAIRSAIKKTVEQQLHKVYRLGPYQKSVKTEHDPLADLADTLHNLEMNGDN